MIPNDNSSYFLASKRTRPIRTDGSWWVGLSRAEHQAAAEARKVVMSNSPEARHTSTVIVGHTGRTR